MRFAWGDSPPLVVPRPLPTPRTSPPTALVARSRYGTRRLIATLLRATRLVSGAYLRSDDLQRVVADLTSEVELIYIRPTRGLELYSPRIDHTLISFESFHAPLPGGWPVLPTLYLFGGSPALPDSLARKLAWPPASRVPLSSLRSKDMTGGQLRFGGMSPHLVSREVLRILPVSERFFLWWDERTDGGRQPSLRIEPERDDHGYPTPDSSDDSFTLRQPTVSKLPSLMLALSPVAFLIILLKSVRDEMAHIDLQQARMEGGELRSEVPASCRHAVLSALEAHGPLGVRAEAIMGRMLVVTGHEAEGDGTSGSTEDDIVLSQQSISTMAAEEATEVTAAVTAAPVDWSDNLEMLAELALAEEESQAPLQGRQRHENAILVATYLGMYLDHEPEREDSIRYLLRFGSRVCTPASSRPPSWLHTLTCARVHSCHVPPRAHSRAGPAPAVLITASLHIAPHPGPCIGSSRPCGMIIAHV